MSRMPRIGKCKTSKKRRGSSCIQTSISSEIIEETLLTDSKAVVLPTVNGIQMPRPIAVSRTNIIRAAYTHIRKGHAYTKNKKKTFCITP